MGRAAAAGRGPAVILALAVGADAAFPLPVLDRRAALIAGHGAIRQDVSAMLAYHECFSLREINASPALFHAPAKDHCMFRMAS